MSPKPAASSNASWPETDLAVVSALLVLHTQATIRGKEARAIRRAAARAEATFAKLWQTIFATMRPSRTAVSLAIRHHDPVSLMAALMPGTTAISLASPAIERVLTTTYIRGLETSASLLNIAPLKTMAEVPTSLYTEATAWAQQHAATLVSEVTEETRAAIRLLVARAFSDGIPPRPLAKLILEQTTLGLTTRQMHSLLNLRQILRDLPAGRVFWNGARRLVAPECGFSETRITQEVGRAAARLLRQRALTIARTETIRASREGQQRLWASFKQRGYIADGAQQVWSAAPDERTCPICHALDGQQANLDGVWTTIQGHELAGPPAHPNCRCSLVLAP